MCHPYLILADDTVDLLRARGIIAPPEAVKTHHERLPFVLTDRLRLTRLDGAFLVQVVVTVGTVWGHRADDDKRFMPMKGGMWARKSGQLHSKEARERRTDAEME